MKSCLTHSLLRSRLLLVGLLPLAGIGNSYADAQLNPNQLTGSISFSNQNPVIQQVLAEEGISTAYMRADSVNLTPVLNNNMSLYLDGGSQFDYQMTVESSDSGIQYAVSADLRLDGRNERYVVFPQTSGPVYPEPAADTQADIEQCAALADVRFVDTNGSPVNVSGGYMHAWKMEGSRSRLQAQDFGITNGSSQDFLVIEGDSSEYKMDIVYDFGSDFYVDKVRNLCQVQFSASCDEIVPVDCVVDGGPLEFGQITGNVSVNGETLVDQNHLTRMVATNGPYRNQRYDHVAGSGPFNLQNLVPSTVVDPAVGYIVYGEMAFRSGYQFQYLRTPMLSNTNGLVMVYPGENTDMGNTFDLDPGYINGSIELVGPVSEMSALQHIYRDADYDRDGDGIPNNIYVSNSHINAYGTYQKAEGAQYSSSGGYTRSIFDGNYNADTGQFNGDYQLALAGLNGEASIWALNDLVLRFDNVRSRATSSDAFHNAYMRLHNNQLGYRQIDPGESQQVDHNYCFNEVQLAYKSLSGVFYNPRLRAYGSHKGEDYRGMLVDYRAYVDYARGLPLNSLAASNAGIVTLSMPQGFYDITPEVTAINPNGSQTNTELPALTLDVGCGQVIRASTEIQLSVGNLPQETSDDTITINGEINANVPVVSIDYVINAQAPVVVCNSGNCAPDGTFSAEVPLDAGSNAITVTATADDGSEASVSTVVEYSEPEPLTPITLSQCSDIRTVAQDNQSAIVSFEPVATGGCSIPKVSCDTQSGSSFAIGNHSVSCSAYDSCDQTAACEFSISVEAPEVEEPKVIEPETTEPESVETTVDIECQPDPLMPVLNATNTVNVLWSPNHELVPVGYRLELTHCDEELEDSLTTYVYSDEMEMPGKGRGNGHHAADAVMTEQGLALRAERDGNGDGRVYLLISQVTDSVNETHTSCSAVVVAHDKKRQSLQEVLAQAKNAVRYCKLNAEPPSDYYPQGESEVLGPKQTVKSQPQRHDRLNADLLSFAASEVATTDEATTTETTTVESGQDSQSQQPQLTDTAPSNNKSGNGRNK